MSSKNRLKTHSPLTASKIENCCLNTMALSLRRMAPTSKSMRRPELSPLRPRPPKPTHYLPLSVTCGKAMTSSENASELTAGSLFSGIGGLDLGFERAGFRIAWQVEIDRFCRTILATHWPAVQRFADVRSLGSECLRCPTV